MDDKWLSRRSLGAREGESIKTPLKEAWGAFFRLAVTRRSAEEDLEDPPDRLEEDPASVTEVELALHLPLLGLANNPQGMS